MTKKIIHLIFISSLTFLLSQCTPDQFASIASGAVSSESETVDTTDNNGSTIEPSINISDVVDQLAEEVDSEELTVEDVENEDSDVEAEDSFDAIDVADDTVEEDVEEVEFVVVPNYDVGDVMRDKLAGIIKRYEDSSAQMADSGVVSDLQAKISEIIAAEANSNYATKEVQWTLIESAVVDIMQQNKTYTKEYKYIIVQSVILNTLAEENAYVVQDNGVKNVVLDREQILANLKQSI